MNKKDIQKEKDSLSAYPNQNLDRIAFPLPLTITFTRPRDKWQADDDRFFERVNEQAERMNESKDMRNFMQGEKFFDINRRLQEIDCVKRMIDQLRQTERGQRG